MYLLGVSPSLISKPMRNNELYDDWELSPSPHTRIKKTAPIPEAVFFLLPDCCSDLGRSAWITHGVPSLVDKEYQELDIQRIHRHVAIDITAFPSTQ